MGINDRVSAQSAQKDAILSEQFALAQQDVEAGRYAVANQRLNYILEQNSSYPGAAELLTKVLVQQAITPTAVPTATPTITPTADLREQETIFGEAQQQVANKDWSAALGSLDSLRKADPAYKVVQVDGMYYTALRNRGIDQIMGIGAYTSTNLEGGIYDLTVAERFAPLDGYAAGVREGASQFLTAASFFGIDWVQSLQYFGEVNRLYPNLRDASGMTASQYYYQSLLNYGDILAAEGQGKSLSDRCQALDYWGSAQSIAGLDETYGAKFNRLYNQCYPPTATPDPALLITPEVPTPEPTASGG